jgi:uncharacterized protein (DUF302 family)
MTTGLIVGFLLGAAVATVAFVATARSRMLEVFPSPFATVEETVDALEKGLGMVDGWSSPGTRDMNGMMAKHGVSFAPKVRLVEMCKARYAAEVLRTDRKVATLMPCAVAVYEDDQGKVWLSKMNLGLMARLFGGNVGRVMGGLVADEEKRILAGLGTG